MTGEELRNTPQKAIREELGGGYYYRCPWLSCDKVLRSDWLYCPYCGTRVYFDTDDSYTADYRFKHINY